jgi:hypothetical protein
VAGLPHPNSLPGPSLRDEIRRSIHPVTAVRPPGRRALLFVAVSAALLAFVAIVWGRAVRPIPPELLALVWIAHTATATVLFAAALAESIPGRLLGPGRLAALLALGGAVVVSSALTLFVLAPYVPPWLTRRVTAVCLSRAYALGLLPLTIAVAASMQGLTSRPVSAGTLAGLGSGLLVESSWRLYCSVTETGHAIIAHLGATALLTATGAAAGLRLSSRGAGRDIDSLDD